MDKKEIIKALEQHFEVKAKYMGAPSFAYQIQAGDEVYTVTREGNIEDAGDRQVELDSIIGNSELADKESVPCFTEQGIESVEIALPLTGHTGISLKNMVNMIYSKQTLIQKALSLEEKMIDEGLVRNLSDKAPQTMEDFKDTMEAGKASCPGICFDFEQDIIIFKLGQITSEQIKAIAELVALINQQAKTQKHASSRPVETDNDKYAFRTWLLRLGMIGDQYKATRKTLLANIEGNGAFRKVAATDE